jgi:hypothetical protein
LSSRYAWAVQRDSWWGRGTGLRTIPGIRLRVAETEITLEAPVERIWQLASDCSLYSGWNPLFQAGAGQMRSGERLELRVHLPGISPFVVNPTVLVADPESRFRWRHTWLWGGLLSWEYGIELEIVASNRLTLRQRSDFGGVLAPLFNFALKGAVVNGLIALNGAFRRWGEKGNVQCLRC